MKRFVHVAAMVGALAAAPAAGEELVVDLSGSVVAITTGFVGSDLLLFGATEGAGDIVVVVRGTQGDERVRRKGKVAGIWINRDEMIFNGVPGFYSVAASRPLDDILIAAEQFDNQIGGANLRLEARDPARPRVEVEAFREALIRNKQSRGLYGSKVGKVHFIENRLFRTSIHFPANVPVGTYVVDTYLAQGGRVTGNKTTLLEVRKFGFEARVYDLAHRHSLAYGLLAILIAVVAGWFAGIVARER
ncbi:MAG: TIGR02186 family protein [Rhodospirillales bacterium]|jgi:uncharacterized protein (TIGR02186 family)|nr:TIGR02186 family protein [Rhodospirillales bacterium]